MKCGFIFVIILFSYFGFSQQFLWSTTKTMNPEGKEVPIIPLSDVTQKVLEYYDFYEYYYDLTGFSKTGFKQFLINNPSTAEIIHWDPTLMAHEQIALAFKGNEGRGSIVIVMLIQKDNIDIISFSNYYDSKLAISTISYEEDKFKKWFTSFWHPNNKDTNNSLEQISEDYEVKYNLSNRKYIIRPHIEDKGLFSGKVVVECKIDRQGKVLYTRAGVKGTTIPNSELYRECERALLEAKFNQDESAPEYQIVKVVFNFRIR